MVKTGIKKYDELPSRRGLMDIDSLRYAYLKAKKRFKDIKFSLDSEVKITKTTGRKDGKT